MSSLIRDFQITALSVETSVATAPRRRRHHRLIRSETNRSAVVGTPDVNGHNRSSALEVLAAFGLQEFRFVYIKN